MIRSIFFDGKNSNLNFGLRILKSNFTLPQKKTVYVDMPYHNGSPDFTYANGRCYYEQRTIEYTMFIKAQNYTELEMKIAEIANWLNDALPQKLYDTLLGKYHWTSAYCTEVTPVIDEDFPCAEITVVFSVDPFKSTKDYADIAFDSFSFEHDYMNLSEIICTSSDILNVYSYAGEPIIPCLSYRKFTADTDKKGLTCLKVNDEMLNGNIYRADDEEFFRKDFIIQPGENTISASGFGELTIRLSEVSL